ncbi:MAG: CopD family protein [Gammaproteobacteria bacterium]
MYLLLKSLHLIFVVTWFAGLFYLPRLYVYHSTSVDETGIQRFELMEKKLYHGIMWPSMLLTLCTGTGLVVINDMSWVSQSAWLQIKILIVISLCIYQLYLGRLRKVFVLRANKHGHVFYRWLNEAPVIALIAIIFLAVFKPSLWVT